MAESHIERRDGQRPRKKNKRNEGKKKRPKAWKNYVKAQSAYIWYAKGMREENKGKAQSAFEKKEM